MHVTLRLRGFVGFGRWRRSADLKEDDYIEDDMHSEEAKEEKKDRAFSGEENYVTKE